jgi:hypothetical protein
VERQGRDHIEEKSTSGVPFSYLLVVVDPHTFLVLVNSEEVKSDVYAKANISNVFYFKQKIISCHMEGQVVSGCEARVADDDEHYNIENAQKLVFRVEVHFIKALFLFRHGLIYLLLNPFFIINIVFLITHVRVAVNKHASPTSLPFILGVNLQSQLTAEMLS